MKYVKRSEALREAYRLTKMTGREIDARTVECDCDGWDYCPTCAGNGCYSELYYLFCNHAVKDDDHDEAECIESFCAERERVRNQVLEEDQLEVV